MIPYVAAPDVMVAGHALSVFRLLVALAVVVGVCLALVWAPRTGSDRRSVAALLFAALPMGFAGSRVLALWQSEPAHGPMTVTQIARFWLSMSSVGGFAGAVAGAWLLAALLRWPRQRARAALDAVALAFPFAWSLGRLGCALEHDHPGVQSDHWLAVRFPSGPRFDLGLMELGWTLGIAIAFAALSRRPRPAGFYTALFFVLYCPGRFALDFLRVWDSRYAGLTLAQWAALVGGTVGLAVLRRLITRTP